MISIENVSKAFGGVSALQEVSLEVPRGAIYGIVGASGAGKSTLIRCVNRLEQPDSGRVLVNGEEITALNADGLRQARRQIGMIFQHFNLLHSRTVAENIEFPLEIIGTPRAERQGRVAELLELVELSEKARAYPGQLSGGQKQRVGIARALATQPTVLLSDEATSALDPQTTITILNLLRDLNRRLGLTILLITHEMAVIQRICDYAAILEHGRVVERGAVYHLAQHPASRLSQALFPNLGHFVAAPGAVALTLTFVGDAAEQPVLADLVRRYDVDINIRGGSIQEVASRRLGRLQLQLSGRQAANAVQHLQRGAGLHVEVH